MEKKEKRIKKVLSAFLAFAITVGMLGCGKNEEGTKNDSSGKGDTVKIGYLQDITGDYANAGTIKYQGAQFAVQKLNENGGINGKEVELVVYDSASDTSKAEEGAKKLYLDDNVDVIIGSYSSASVELIRGVAEEYNKIFFFDNVYEAGTFSHNFFDVALGEDVQLDTLIQYMTETFGTKVYCLYSDYNWGQISNEWVEYIADKYGAEIVGSTASPFATTDFTDVIADIEKCQPDYIITEISGGSMNGFFKQAKAKGLDIPMGSTVNLINGEHITLGKDVMNNMYTTTNYAEEVDTEENKKFVKEWKENFDTTYVGADAFIAYATIMMYAQAVEKAGTTEVEAVIDALESGLVYESPVGEMTIDAKSHAGVMKQYLLRCDEEKGIEVLKEFEPIVPTFADELGLDLTKMENGDSKTGKYTPKDLKN